MIRSSPSPSPFSTLQNSLILPQLSFSFFFTLYHLTMSHAFRFDCYGPSSPVAALRCCHRKHPIPPSFTAVMRRRRRSTGLGTVRCASTSGSGSGSKGGIGLSDFIGGDLVKLDLGRWLSDVEEHKALAIYTPHEGGYEGRYFTRLRYQGYYFLDLTARGLGDPETTLTKVHPVCPAHVGKQPIARWYFPPEVDYRLAALPEDAKGLVVWIIEAKVLSKSELQFLALLPSLRPKVRVIAECGNWRKFMWKPLKEISGLTPITDP